MTATPFYCPTCGAANSVSESVCFACKRQLDQVEDEQTDEVFLEKRYEVLSQVGTGGFGAVYKARDMANENEVVAVKQINLRGLSSQETIEATDGFNREVQLLSALSHEHLPRIHDHFTDAEHWYLVMDFIAGETLERYLMDEGTVAVDAEGIGQRQRHFAVRRMGQARGLDEGFLGGRRVP